MDYGHKQSDVMLQDLEKRIKAEYKQAILETQKIANERMASIKKNEAEMRKLLKDGKITRDEMQKWWDKQFFMREKYSDMQRDMLAVYQNADKVAMQMINEHRFDIYALNYNYGTYEVEKGANINTSFALYDRNTVTRLIKDDPKLLPPPGKVTSERIRRGELQRWNRQQIQSVMTQGILQGQSVDKIAKNLAKTVGEKNEYQHYRAARTMTTSAENAGRIDAYKRAEELGIKMKKQWLAAHDSRTRKSHRHYDGMAIPLNEEFATNLAFPGDPLGPAEEVYNCRCTLVASFDGFETDFSKEFQPVGYDTYEDWVAGHSTAKRTREQGGETYIDKIKAIQNDQNLTQTEKVMKSGEVLAEEMNSQYLKPLQDNVDAAEKAYKQSETYKEVQNLGNQLKIVRNDMSIPYGERMTKLNDISDKIRNLRNDAEYTRLAMNYERALQAASLDNYEKHSKALFDKLSEIRSMGADGFNIKAHLNNSRSPVRKQVEFAYGHYPSSWIEASVKRGVLHPKAVNRGFYDGWYIAINGWESAEQIETAFHELGHRFEDVVPSILAQEKEFYERRTSGESLKWLGKGYGKGEKTREDKFIHIYMGKDYGGSAYELVSMGFQYAYTNPAQLAKDPDMQAWIYGILCTL